ncbi:hypothetical protein GGF32_009906 [Allomyces javanicus]|nr:hypothetical protein GGF32_009906 [Allomyces javanicus]
MRRVLNRIERHLHRPSTKPPAMPATPVVLAYYTSWSAYEPRNYHALDMPVEHLTHINYAFANIKHGKIALGDSWADVERAHELKHPDGSPAGTFRGNFEVLNRPDSPFRRRNPNIRTLISIGGWTFSKDFSLVARTPESRHVFTQSVLDFVTQHRFDGVDLDWEYPVEGGMDHNHRHPDDGRNFTLLLRQLRSGLDVLAQSLGRERYLLTVATGATEHTARHFDVPGLAETCDWINVMTYDAAGPWSSTAAHHAPLDFATTSLALYQRLGAPTCKLALGVPFYGRSFTGVRSIQSGQPYGGTGPGTHEPGVVDWDDLCANYTPAQGYVREGCVWWHPQTGVWVGADDEEAMMRKGRLAREMGLAGVFWWEMSMDKRAELVRAVRRGMGYPG